MSKFLQKYGHCSSIHVNVTDDHEVIDKALNDEYISTREAAAGNHNYKKYYPNGHK